MRRMRLLPIAFLAAGLSGGTSAQLLPAGLPIAQSVPELTPSLIGNADTLAAGAHLRATFDGLRRAQVRDLLRVEHSRLDLDPLGEPVLRGEFLAMGTDATTLAAIGAAGFEAIGRAGEGQALGLDIVVLRDARRRDAQKAMRALRAAAPGVEFAYQHVFLPASGGAGGPVPAAAAPGPGPIDLRVGLIDGGVDATAVPGLHVQRFGCGGRAIPQMHGTAVALRLGANATGTLYAADLWCGDRVGRATLGLVEALGWMARERVPVVNVSLVGPDNPVLARAVQAMVARGHVIVAAVGNDGPAAPPLYPAAYPGVIGVSAVDAKLRVLPESGSGPQVDFSAPGIAGPHARGTSFAAPVVARVAAGLLRAPSPSQAREAHDTLANRARDLGAPGRDARYGDGLITPF